MQAQRYQYGDLRTRKRKNGSDVWQFRFFENGKRKAMTIGTIEKLPTMAHAERAVEHIRSKINAENPQKQFHTVTVETLANRYITEEMEGNVRKDTADTYRGILKNWICPEWGVRPLESVKTIAVEDWLKNYSPGTRYQGAYSERDAQAF